MTVIALLSLVSGFIAGRASYPPPDEDTHVLPTGLPRSCCEGPALTEKQQELVKTLKWIVGKDNILDGREENSITTTFLRGARLGHGTALAIVRPTKLKQVADVVQAVADAGCVVVVQGSNTGLTGGSVPRQQGDDRPTVVISMKYLDTIFPIDNGERVVCLAGVGLATLKRFVESNFPDRESHSILGSTFLNPTTAAGVAFGSGGTQCRKGPAFTERALYLKVIPDKYGKSVVTIVNRLGIEGFDAEEGELTYHGGVHGVITDVDKYVSAVKGEVERTMKKSNKSYGLQPSHDLKYKEKLCKLDNQVSRFNADTTGCECNRSEGKVLILASVHDTFKAPAHTKSYWLSFDELDTAQRFRSEVCLDNPADVPVSIEYMDRDSFDVIDRAGRVAGDLIKILGTASPTLSSLWGMKLYFEGLNFVGASTLPDKILYFLNPIFPPILPKQIMEMGTARDHHIAITIGDFEGSLDRFEERFTKFRNANVGKLDVHECTTKSERDGVTAFRFIAAPAFRTYCVGQGLQGVSVDYALPKNFIKEPELPVSNHPVKRMRYSHFGCNVVHEDLAYEPGVDTHEAKMELKGVVDHECGGKLPAEHGHGTEYHAPKDTQRRWQRMDPLNVMNPGVGGLSSKYRYQE